MIPEIEFVNYWLKSSLDKYELLDTLAGVNLTVEELKVIKTCDIDGISMKEAENELRLSIAVINKRKKSAKLKIYKYLTKNIKK